MVRRSFAGNLDAPGLKTILFSGQEVDCRAPLNTVLNREDPPGASQFGETAMRTLPPKLANTLRVGSSLMPPGQQGGGPCDQYLFAGWGPVAARAK